MTMMRRLSFGRVVGVSSLLLVLLGVAIAVSIAVGSVKVPISDLYRLVWNRLFGAYAQAQSDLSVIVFSLRVPRILLASVVGAGLAIAGAAFQALLRNPLADPYVLGVSSGASFGILLTTSGLGLLPASLQMLPLTWIRPLAAFLGALLVITTVYFIAGGRTGTSTNRLLLAGIIIGAFLSSVNTFFLITSKEYELRGFMFWLIGDLSRPVSGSLELVTIIVLIGSLLIYLLSRSLNLMSVSEEDALALGVNVPLVRTLVYLVTSLMTGAVVSMSGAIAYVGLIVPHIVRLMLGSDYRILIPAVFLIGALFTVVADTVARTIVSPTELPVGVITALCGAPVFIYLLRKRGV